MLKKTLLLTAVILLTVSASVSAWTLQGGKADYDAYDAIQSDLDSFVPPVNEATAKKILAHELAENSDLYLSFDNGKEINVGKLAKNWTLGAGYVGKSQPVLMAIDLDGDRNGIVRAVIFPLKPDRSGVADYEYRIWKGSRARMEFELVSELDDHNWYTHDQENVNDWSAYLMWTWSDKKELPFLAGKLTDHLHGKKEVSYPFVIRLFK